MRNHWIGPVALLWLALACGSGGGNGGGQEPTGQGGEAGDGEQSRGGSKAATGGAPSTGGSDPGDDAGAGGGGADDPGAGGAGARPGGDEPGGAGGDTNGGAAGEPGSFLPAFGRGTRLSVKALEFEDMPPVFVTFHDTKLGTDCRFTQAADGSLRCLPAFTPASPLFFPDLFLDDECTVPVALGDPTCVPATDGFTERMESLGNCEGNRLHIYRATLVEDGTQVYSRSGSDCVLEGETGGPYLHFRLTEMAPDEFVAGEEQVPPTPTRLSVQRLVAEDGAFTTLALADPETNTSCRVFEGDGNMCIPAVAWSARSYRTADAECEESLSHATCQPPLYVVDYDTEGLVVFEAGPKHTGPVYGGVNACAEITGEGPFYTIGDRVDTARFATLTSEYYGSGRLRHRVFRDEAGTLLAAGNSSGDLVRSEGGLFDAAFDDSCTLRRYKDLELYCVPNSVHTESFYNLYYADPDCTKQVAVCGDKGCPTDLALLQDMTVSGMCGAPPEFTAVLTLGDEIALDELYIFYGGSEPGSQCQGPFPTTGYGIIREVTGETGVDDFAKLTPSED